MCCSQVVAVLHGGLVSVYDGRTQYKLGQSLHAKRGGAAWPPLDACYFAFPNMQQVHHAMVTMMTTSQPLTDSITAKVKLHFISWSTFIGLRFGR